ncbi:MAG: hypothetical protein KDA79_23780, partial [Planctomycetaceae bacterium]|nr:hypothetical protein [Planctomycetaceae bacterium]
MTADDSSQPAFPERPGTAESAQLPESETQLPGGGSAGDSHRLPEELPPVEPPSAGFIVQLFLVPGLIVAAIIGVWVLFGRIAEGRQDWRELVAELPSGNEQRRWRAALGLAQML